MTFPRSCVILGTNERIPQQERGQTRMMYLAVCLAYFIKGLTGFANTLVLTATMSFFRSSRDITPLDLLLSLPANLLLALRQWCSIQWRKALPLAGLTLAGCIPGTLLLRGASPAALKIVFGVLLIGLGLERLLRPAHGTGKQSPLVQGCIAAVSGMIAGLFGVGALLAASMSRTADSPEEYRATLGLVFAVENIFRIVLYSVMGLLHAAMVVDALKLVPCMLVGMLAGSALSKRMNPQRLTQAVMVMLMISGLALILQNL